MYHNKNIIFTVAVLAAVFCVSFAQDKAETTAEHPSSEAPAQKDQPAPVVEVSSPEPTRVPATELSTESSPPPLVHAVNATTTTTTTESTMMGNSSALGSGETEKSASGVLGSSYLWMFPMVCLIRMY